MSRENVVIVRRAYGKVNTHLDVPAELPDPDYEFDASEVAPNARRSQPAAPAQPRLAKAAVVV